MRKTINFVAFYAVWFACVGGAANGASWLGPVVVTTFLVFHFLFLSAARHEARLLCAAAGLGVLVEWVHLETGALSVAGAAGFPYPPPLWLIALWLAFAATLNHSLSWLRGRYWLGIAFGALGGPLSYYAGTKLQAASFPDPTFSLVVIAVVWAVAMPALLWADDRLRARARATGDVRMPAAGPLSAAAPAAASRTRG